MQEEKDGMFLLSPWQIYTKAISEPMAKIILYLVCIKGKIQGIGKDVGATYGLLENKPHEGFINTPLVVFFFFVLLFCDMFQTEYIKS